jgi:ATP-binding cassette subfamily F protein 2
VDEILSSALDAASLEEKKRDAALEKLQQDSINVIYENRRGNLHANTRDVLVTGVTITFHGKPLVEDTDIQINYGNRYGFIGPNGSGKSTIMKVRNSYLVMTERYPLLYKDKSMRHPH